ncbi:alpha-1,2-fucosyltransferase [Brevibacterium yomogidense]|uniref:alpha-1,2-fucosyltransferase n=1 Tax=Brevibacterium yomogidense TaxID=946573 RepID=UPI0018E064AC|nr:alpha-1,2-fucosyltransferase [Brevibacterium yomogidense]
MFRINLNRALDLIRARPGSPEVQFTPEAVRGGNILYYWQWAFAGRALGMRRSVLETDQMARWLQEFPALKQLTVPRADIGLLDQRTFATRHHFGTSFTSAENLAFSLWLLQQTPSFGSRVASAREFVTAQTCVLNVRRGDYYSVPEFRAEFGIDVRSHVSEAIRILKDLGRWTEQILIVSDDPDWCRENLLDVLPGDTQFVPRRMDMFDDLAALAAARTLILANSTFSYWGSFFANALQPDHMAVAPPFHQRLKGSGVVTDLFDPEWSRTSLPREQRDAP